MIKLGPILGFRGNDNDIWRLSVLLVVDASPGVLTWNAGGSGGTEDPEELYAVGGDKVWRFTFDLAQGNTETTATYTILGVSHDVAVPAKATNPRCFFASCNGFSSLKLMKGVRDKNALWDRMRALHDKQPNHLLLMGGDQVYADSMWETVPTMSAWNELSFDDGNDAPTTPAMLNELKNFYFNLYVSRWSQPQIAHMMARVPMIAMWDDHDIIDGWGSYPTERNTCDVLKAIFDAARTAFAVFQQQLTSDLSEPPHGSIAADVGFTRGHIVGKTAILALDMRSERTQDQVLTADHWKQVYQWLDDLKELEHLFLVSSIPVVYPGFDVVEAILGWIPGQQELEDDLRDHWNSHPHKGERLRLIHRLLRLAENQGIRPTILSGDVHVAALGVIESRRAEKGGGEAVINQLISSGIVHPGPPGLMLLALKRIFDSDDEIDRGLMARMINFPGLKYGFIGNRNFMSLEPDDDGRIWANWIVEGDKHPIVKVIHALEQRATA